MHEGYRMSLVISFVQKLKGLTEMNCGLVFPLSLCRKVELCMERNRRARETIEWLRCFPILYNESIYSYVMSG